ncbi:MAG: hypothetical protein LC797_23010 [Chloroflexi bacterium]|nr:hypothetical protein [Chloroflexota bacterium]
MTTDSRLPIACSLTPGEYAERFHEFRRLFTTSLQDSRREPTRLFLRLDAAKAHEADVRDLLRREQECCPFFSFDVQLGGDVLLVEAQVPDGADECLDELERLATRMLTTQA